MKWSTLKKLIDDRLAEQGQDADPDVWYIDVSFPDEPNRIDVDASDPCGLAVA